MCTAVTAQQRISSSNAHHQSVPPTFHPLRVANNKKCRLIRVSHHSLVVKMKVAATSIKQIIFHTHSKLNVLNSNPSFVFAHHTETAKQNDGINQKIVRRTTPTYIAAIIYTQFSDRMCYISYDFLATLHFTAYSEVVSGFGADICERILQTICEWTLF